MRPSRRTKKRDLSALRTLLARPLVAIILGQICLHSCMTGVRMATPLLALRQGHATWAVGVLMGLFALAPIALALPAGRLADRRGYHVPMRVAVALTVSGGAIAALSTWLGAGQFAVLCVAASLTGAGANFGLIAIQRSAGRHARDATERKRVFSWLGLAPALSNVVGPVLAGAMIDLGGFRWAFIVLALLPLATLAWARRVPVEVPAPRDPAAPKASAWDLFLTPGVAPAAAGELAAVVEPGTCIPSSCRSSATSAVSAPRPSASCLAPLPRRCRWCDW